MTDRIGLEDVLDRIADALQRGALKELEPLNRLIMAQMENRAALDPTRAKGVQWRAARNATLLQAAARGVRAARSRIDGLQGASATFSTYGADGRMVQVGRSASGHTSRM